MQRRKLTPKEVFRTLAFHYHLEDGVPVDLLAEMVSSLYYPNNPTGPSRLNYKSLLVTFLKEHNNYDKVMSEPRFVEFMNSLTRHSNEEYLGKLTDRIFNRYCLREEDVIEEEGFAKMALSFGIKKEEMREFFLSVADLKNQITRDKFREYVNALTTARK